MIFSQKGQHYFLQYQAGRPLLHSNKQRIDLCDFHNNKKKSLYFLQQQKQTIMVIHKKNSIP